MRDWEVPCLTSDFSYYHRICEFGVATYSGKTHGRYGAIMGTLHLIRDRVIAQPLWSLWMRGSVLYLTAFRSSFETRLTGNFSQLCPERSNVQFQDLLSVYNRVKHVGSCRQTLSGVLLLYIRSFQCRDTSPT